MATVQKTETSQDNLFLATLQRHRGGLILEDASAELRRVVQGVKDTGKAGVLTIQIGVKPASKGQSAVVLVDKVTAKVPSEEVEASFWFATDEGGLQKDDPRQTTFKMGVVEGQQETAEPKRRAAVNE